MNLVIIGGKNPEQMAQLLYKSFDDIEILNYADTNMFLETVAHRALEVHRMLLLQDGIDNLSDDDVYNFVDLIQASYPAMKLISICKDKDTIKFIAGLFNGVNYAHFLVTTSKVKMIIDFASLEVPVLQKKYQSIAFIMDNKSDVEILDDFVGEVEEDIPNTAVVGYIPPEVTNIQKRGLFSKIFGIAPKSKKGKLLKDGELKEIGQGQGVSEFYENEENEPFVSSESEEETVDFTVFGGDSDSDLGLGTSENDNVMDEIHSIMENHLNNDDGEILEEEPFEEEEFYLENVSENEPEIEPEIEPEVEVENVIVEEVEYTPTILDIPESVEEPYLEEEVQINVPSIDLGDLKNTLKNTNLKVSDDIVIQNPVDNISMNIDSVEDEEIDLFGDNLESIMYDYEESNRKVVEVEKVIEVEKVVEKIITVNTGTNKYRNKNGVKIVIITGDRRIGSTKLALNLANIYSKKEKVLYVDFDRFRHGSLGYLDLDAILEEQEHIQNGLNHLKSLNILSNVLHMYKQGGFFTLLSMYGTDIADSQMVTVQELLGAQKEFSTVIIDCPMENLYLLQDIIHLSNVLICAEDDHVGVVNLITSLSTCCVDKKSLTYLFDKSQFVVGRKGNIDKFKIELNNVVELFGLDEGLFNWGSLNIVGSIKKTPELAERLGD